MGARPQPTRDNPLLGSEPGSRVNDNADFRFVIKKVEETLQTARRADVTVYPIDPIGLEAPTGGAPVGLKPERDFLIMLANGTGGFAVVDTNDTPTEVSRIYRENSSYYPQCVRTRVPKSRSGQRPSVLFALRPFVLPPPAVRQESGGGSAVGAMGLALRFDVASRALTH